MNRALIVPFHHYAPHYKENYRLVYEYFKKQLQVWGDEVDHVYFIDSDDYLYPTEEQGLQALHKNITVIKTNNFSHAQTLQFAISQVQENICAIIDMDTFIYREGILEKYYEMIRKREVEIAAMVELPGPGRISRFAPYFCVLNMETYRALKEPDFDPHPEEGHLDPMAKLTHELIKKGARFYSVPDDRSTLQMLQTGEIKSTRTAFYGSGLYHARNFNGGIHLVDTYLCMRDDFERNIALMPKEEVSRIFGWNTIIALETGTHKKLIETIEEITARWWTKEQWSGYIEKFYNFHQYIKL